jgi:Flp pilus assembly protein TadD
MSRMLTLIDAAWASARDLATAGRRADALALLTTLLARPDLPAGPRAKAHRLAAALHLQADRFAAARRHLLAAAKLEPGNADTQYQLGIAFGDDPYGCDERAARRFRRATRLDPENPVYWAALGRAAVRVNKDRFALRALRKAVALAPADAAVLTVVIEALREAGRGRVAWKVVCNARFLAPADTDLRRLWERVRFDRACARQMVPNAATGASAVLPFVCVVGEGRVVRRDGGSQPTPHFRRLTVRE